MRAFKHVNAATVREALSLLKENPGARLNAGGTDLLGVLKADILPVYPDLLVNIKTIPGLDYIKKEKDMLKIGAMTRLADIAENPLIRDRYSMLARAAASVATPEIRNMGTIGGNLCQDTRCMYYRYPHQLGKRFICWRKGGNQCLAVKGDNRYHAIMGARKCFAVCPSDMAVALTALDATIKIASLDGERDIPVKDLYNPLGINLDPGEMITGIQIPQLTENAGQEFIKFTLRKPIDFAIVSVAVVFNIESNTCKYAGIALGGLAHVPVRLTSAEQRIKGNRIDGDIAASAAEEVAASAMPLSMNSYKIGLAKTLVRRAILSALNTVHL